MSGRTSKSGTWTSKGVGKCLGGAFRPSGGASLGKTIPIYQHPLAFPFAVLIVGLTSLSRLGRSPGGHSRYLEGGKEAGGQLVDQRRSVVIGALGSGFSTVPLDPRLLPPHRGRRAPLQHGPGPSSPPSLCGGGVAVWCGVSAGEEPKPLAGWGWRRARW